MRRSEIPSLDDLRAFEAVARLGSVRMAADDLALTHGAISRRVTRLSRDLGLPLLEKSGRGLQLTPAGEVLKVTIGRFFGEFAAAVDHLRSAGAERNAVALSCEPSVAMRWLIPRLAGFYADGSQYGLLWTGDRELGGSAAILADWLQDQVQQTVMAGRDTRVPARPPLG